MLPESVERYYMNRNRLFIITRFNIAVNYGASKYNTYVPTIRPWLDEVYLEKRFDIFEKYTFPSLKRQTDTDYEWIVLFHTDTPHTYRQRIQEYESEMPNFKPWFLNDDESRRAIDLVGEYLYKVKEDSSNNVISVRIDNDDMVHRDFIKTIREKLEYRGSDTYLSFKNGLSYNLLTGYCALYDYVGNHFLSMVSGSQITYILQAGVHDQVMNKNDDSEKIVMPSKVPMWVELISDTNCANVIKWCGIKRMFIPYDTAMEYPELNMWRGHIGYLAKCISAPIRYYWHTIICVIKYKSEWRRG